jgi:hypothetical protein
VEGKPAEPGERFTVEVSDDYLSSSTDPNSENVTIKCGSVLHLLDREWGREYVSLIIMLHMLDREWGKEGAPPYNHPQQRTAYAG